MDYIKIKNLIEHYEYKGLAEIIMNSYRREQPERSELCSRTTEGRSASKDTAEPYRREASKDTAEPYRREASKDTAKPYP